MFREVTGQSITGLQIAGSIPARIIYFYGLHYIVAPGRSVCVLHVFQRTYETGFILEFIQRRIKITYIIFWLIDMYLPTHDVVSC